MSRRHLIHHALKVANDQNFTHDTCHVGFISLAQSPWGKKKLVIKLFSVNLRRRRQKAEVEMIIPML
jgi:hypothetical protein